MTKSIKAALKRLVFGNAEVQTIRAGIAKGIKMRLDVGSKTQRILGLDELEIQGAFVRAARTCPFLIDVGAADGYYSLIYRKHNPNGVIYIIQASDSAEQRDFWTEQEDNFRLNGFALPPHRYAKFAASIDDDTHLRIDRTFAVTRQRPLIKIDVDGGEVDVLSGMTDTLRNNDCQLVVETHSPQLERDCIAFLERSGYRATIVKAGWYRRFIPERRPLEQNRWLTASRMGS